MVLVGENATGFAITVTGVTPTSATAGTVTTTSFDSTATVYTASSAGGSTPLGAAGAITSSATGLDFNPQTYQAANPINVYSFAISPEEHQPSGTCNFSRIDNATLVFDSIRGNSDDGSYPSKAYPYNFRIYAVNYNIFRIMSGMGGLAYSN
jgi:hypothetical protein